MAELNGGKVEEKVEDHDLKDGDKIITIPEEKPSSSFRDYIRVLTSGTPLTRALQLLALLLSILSGITLPLMPLLFGRLVNLMTALSPTTTTTPLPPSSFLSQVNTYALYFLLLFLGKLLLTALSLTLFRATGTTISARIRLLYTHSLFSQPIPYLDTLSPSSITIKTTTNAALLQTGISEKLGMGISAISSVLAAFVVAFSQSWELALVTSTIVPAVVMLYGVTIPVDVRRQRVVLGHYDDAARLAGEVLASMRTVKAFNAEVKLARRYQGHLDLAREKGVGKAGLMGGQFAGGHFVIWCGCALCFWYGSRMLERGRLGGVGEMFTVFLAVLVAAVAAMGVSPCLTAVGSAMGVAGGVWEVVDRVPVGRGEGGRRLEGWKGGVRFERVWFGYEGRGRVLRGLDLEFEEGKTTAVVGGSGCGKSTIVALLERWYEPDVAPEGEEKRGGIWVDGTELRELDLKWWRRQIGLVQQEPFLFNDSVFTNVMFGLVGTEWEDASEEVKRELVMDACKEANAHEFVMALPEGYDTQVGEQGIKLSGGQKQRIAIARSIIKRPTILILDEATSALDPKAERIVQDCLDRLAKSRTTITIAHRLSTVKKADKIVVLDGGVITEQGTHEELSRIPGGKYARLVEGQRLTFGKKAEEEENVDQAEPVLERMASRKSVKEVQEDVEAGRTEEEKKMGIWNAFRFILWENRHHWVIYAISIAAVLITGAGYPIQAYVCAGFIGIFGQFTADAINFTSETNFWALMFFILALGIGLGFFLMGLGFTQLQHNLTCTYRSDYLSSFLSQPIPFFDLPPNSSGALSSRLDSDPTSIQEMMGSNFGLLLVALLSTTGCILISLVYSWKLALVTICSALPLVLAAGTIRLHYERKLDTATTTTFASSSRFISDSISSFRTVSALTLEDTILQSYSTLLTSHVRASLPSTTIAMILLSFSESITLAAAALVFWYGSRLMVSGELGLTNYFIVYTALLQGGEAAGNFFAFTPNLVAATAAVTRILSLRPAPPSSTPGITLPDDEGGLKIEFRNVTFCYPNRTVPVFQNLNLTLEPNRFIALVGPSGCGKTTLLSLLQSFYSLSSPHCSGQILINDTPLQSLNLRHYRSLVAVVSQEPTLYQGTIKENILLGIDADPDTPAWDRRIQDAAEKAYIAEFIDSLPEGYNTPLTRTSLSGGQKQRLCIARALIKSPRLLLLDEATSSLDSDSESIVQKSFEASGRTVLAVAHRLSTVRRADEILVFDGGRVVERGGHEELVRRGGVYWGLCRAQGMEG